MTNRNTKIISESYFEGTVVALGEMREVKDRKDGI